MTIPLPKEYKNVSVLILWLNISNQKANITMIITYPSIRYSLLETAYDQVQIITYGAPEMSAYLALSLAGGWMGGIKFVPLLN